jgi:hypothetical protein
VLLRIAAAVHVEHDPPRAVHRAAGLGEGESEVGLADAGGAVHHGQGAGQETAAEHVVESCEAGRNACVHERRFYTARPLTLNWRS